MKKYFIITTLFLCACSQKVDTLVYHSTAYNAKKAIQTYKDHDVSVHYIIEENGNIIKLKTENKKADHAGISYWRKQESINNGSIGIEILEPTLGQQPYTNAQIIATTKLSKEIIAKHNIKPQMIVGHSDIAPQRKPDPGKCFFWQELANNDIGIWYYLPDAKKVKNKSVSQMLSAIGYDTKNLAAAQYAFARRYIPKLVATQNDIKDLLNNPHPKDFDASNNKEFTEILKAVYYRYINEPNGCL